MITIKIWKIVIRVARCGVRVTGYALRDTSYVLRGARFGVRGARFQSKVSNLLAIRNLITVGAASSRDKRCYRHSEGRCSPLPNLCSQPVPRTAQPEPRNAQRATSNGCTVAFYETVLKTI